MGRYSHRFQVKENFFLLVCLFTSVAGMAIFDATAGPLQAEQSGANEIPEPEQSKAVAAVIPCKDFIDDGLYKSIRRRSQEAVDAGATYLIYEIGTYGGQLKAADDIAKYLILDLGKKYHTVAYITTEAISAGALISVSCKDIIMLEHTTIGDCAPISLGGSLEGVEREKAESFTRAAFSRAAQANGYPEALLKAMVTRQIEVYQVKNLATGGSEFFESEYLPDDPNMYDFDNKKIVDRKDEILTLTALRAAEFGIARAQVKDLDGAMKFLSERDGVEFTAKPIVLLTNWSEEMVRWLNSPVVVGILVMLAMLGVYIELNTPGIGLPSLVAVICVVILIGSKYLIGMANWVEIMIFSIGLILLAVEIFIIPGFGITGFAGIVCIVTGLFGMLIRNAPGEVPWPEGQFAWDTFFNGLIGLCIGFAGFLAAAFLFAKYLPRVSFLNGLILSPVGVDADSRTGSVADISASKNISVHIGDIGTAVSMLRPVGQAGFDDKILDVVTEGEYAQPGASVVITKIHGNRVVVRVAEKNSVETNREIKL